jgi:GNAT superfamily N-acetyltransferase/SAM-dependent methyltransferase
MGAESFELRAVRDGDYEFVIARVDDWWGGRSMAPMLPRLFFTHFGPTTIVAADPYTGVPLGFLCGFRSESDRSIGYIHFVGVDPQQRGAGIGRAMYEWFFDTARRYGCSAIECVTSPSNATSLAFHAALGFSQEVVDDYDGRGEPRVKLRRSIEPVDRPRPATADYADANMAWWNSVVHAHAASRDYGLDRYRDDPDHISDVVRFDLPRLGDIHGQRGVHLQCHIGTDTVSLARVGARMTGLDLSAAALDVARRLASDAGTEIAFVEAHTFDAVDVLEPNAFDLVYTGIGALNWLPSIRRWAEVVAGLLLPGGRLFIREGHPVLWALPDARPDGLLALEHPYFETEGVTFGAEGTYVDTDEQLGFAWTVEFNHGLGEIMTALMGQGMTITAFEEHDSIPWVALDGQMEPIGDGEFRLIERPERLPHSYTLQARKQ